MSLPMDHSCYIKMTELIFNIATESRVADPRASENIEVVYLCNQLVDFQRSKSRLSCSKGVSCNNYFCCRMVWFQCIRTSKKVICKILVYSMKSFMDLTTITTILSFDEIKVLKPVLKSNGSPYSNNYSVISSIITTIALSFMRIIKKDLNFLHSFVSMI